MAHLIVYSPNHGYSNTDHVYVSWLDNYYYISDVTINSYKLVTTSGGTNYIEFSTTAPAGYTRKVVTGNTTITGLEHLERELVTLVSSGSYVGSFTVSNGQITAPQTVYSYSIGINYAMKIKSMRLEIPAQASTTQGSIKAIKELQFRYYKSKGGYGGVEYNGTEYLQYLDMKFDTETRDAGILPEGGFNKDGYVIFKSTEPYPVTILCVTIKFELSQ